jgi:hypothetical protein
LEDGRESSKVWQKRLNQGVLGNTRLVPKRSGKGVPKKKLEVESNLVLEKG